MRVGVTLPTFRDDAVAIDAARRGRGARPRRCVRVRPPVAHGRTAAPRTLRLPGARGGGRRHRPGVLRSPRGAASASCPTRSSWPSSLSLRRHGAEAPRGGARHRRPAECAPRTAPSGSPSTLPTSARVSLRRCASQPARRRGAGVGGRRLVHHRRARRGAGAGRGGQPVGGPARGRGRAAPALRGDVGRARGRRRGGDRAVAG